MMIRGSELRTTLQAEVLRRYVYRYTGEHIPQWVRHNRPQFPLHFADDADWLANTFFAVTKQGNLDARVKYCETHPTWPEEKT
jgi:hypothetical protein